MSRQLAPETSQRLRGAWQKAREMDHFDRDFFFYLHIAPFARAFFPMVELYRLFTLFLYIP
jgi:hypothetical protein